MEKRRLPHFENEAEEAHWYFEHREELAEDLISASREGRLGEGSVGRRARKRAEMQDASPPTDTTSAATAAVR